MPLKAMHTMPTDYISLFLIPVASMDICLKKSPKKIKSIVARNKLLDYIDLYKQIEMHNGARNLKL